MSDLSVTERQVGDVTILDFDGKITIGEGREIFRMAVLRTLSGNRARIVLNLRNVHYIDPSGIGEMVSMFTTVGKEGGTLKLLNLPEKTQDLLEITKLLTVFDTYEDEREALASFGLRS